MTAADRPPLFVLGSPRSGTTLLRLMLTCHPSIVIPPECGFAQWLHAAWGDWGAADARDPERVARFVSALVVTRKWETWGLPADAVAAEIQAAHPATYAALVASVYRSYARARGKPDARWGDKNNYYLNHVAELRQLFPDAALVHIVRDGRDVACSYLELSSAPLDSPYSPRLPTDLEGIATEWSHNVGIVDDALAREGGPAVTVRYEDLVRSPAETLTTLLAACGETFHPDMLRSHERNAAEQLEPPAFLQWKQRTLQAPDDRRIGRYRQELSRESIRRLEAVMGATLLRHGYPTDTPLSSP